jgi:hypothetical protein
MHLQHCPQREVGEAQEGAARLHSQRAAHQADNSCLPPVLPATARSASAAAIATPARAWLTRTSADVQSSARRGR